MRVLGLDYGSKTVGVAISDPLGLTAQGVETIWRKQENHLRQTLAHIEELVSEYHVEKIVLGYPKNMNNTIGERAQKSLEFKEMLERRTGLEVIMWDERLTTVSADRTLMERLTTVEANRTLMEASVRRENRKQYLDQLAAVFILQGYLDSLSC
jgi:putative Holliday junction resolvase